MRQAALLLSVVILVAAFCFKLEAQQMNWRTEGAERTPESEFTPIERGNILCHLSNDDTHFYIEMIISHSPTQRMILDSGVNIWIDSEGRRNKSVAVRYPAGAEVVRMQLQARGSRRTEKENRLLFENRPTALAYEIHFAGFGEGGPPRSISADGDEYKAFVRYDEEGNLLYFLKFPRSIFALERDRRGDTVSFSIGIEYGATRAVPSVAPTQGTGAPGGRSGGAGAVPSPPVPPKIVWIRGLMPAAG